MIEAEQTAESGVMGWGLEIRTIEDVEGLHPQLKTERLGDAGNADILHERQIYAHQSRTNELIATLVPLCIQAEYLAIHWTRSSLVAE